MPSTRVLPGVKSSSIAKCWRCSSFLTGDLETSIAMLNRFLNEQEQIPWDALRFVVGEEHAEVATVIRPM